MLIYQHFPPLKLSVPFLPLFQQVNAQQLAQPGLLFAINQKQILINMQNRIPSTTLTPFLKQKGPFLCIGYLSNGLKAYAVAVQQTDISDHQWCPAKTLAPLLNPQEMAAMMRALQLIYFQEEQKFCSKCGYKHVLDQQTASHICPQCGYQVFPLLSPAILALVEKDGHILLGHNAHFPNALYSLIAGFCEVGETAEDTVIREVYEETGLLVHNVRYVASQNWPYPHSLMLGFCCTWVQGHIRCLDNELTDAQWYTVDNLPLLPNKDSLARRMIDQWIQQCAKKYEKTT